VPTTYGLGGSGGGGNGGQGTSGIALNGSPGAANTGGGGGAANLGRSPLNTSATGGAGGSGVVILRYPAFLTITIGTGLVGSESPASNGSKTATLTGGSGNVSWA
jgi:hypothetical protein